LSNWLYREWISFNELAENIRMVRKQLADLRAKANTEQVKGQLSAFSEKLDALAGPETPRPDPTGKITAQTVSARIRTLFSIIQGVDVAPTPQVAAAVTELQTDVKTLMSRWQLIRSQDASALNKELKTAGLPALHLEEPK
jgi:hypothetical protein